MATAVAGDRRKARGPLRRLELRMRYMARFSGEIVDYAVVNRVWWIVPLMLVVAIVTLLVVVGQAAAPFTLYPMF